jgi:hypothetical protein
VKFLTGQENCRPKGNSRALNVGKTLYAVFLEAVNFVFFQEKQ